jgi:hypothetical protein
VALSLGSPPVAVSDHPALWSSDFPPADKICPRSSDLLRPGKHLTIDFDFFQAIFEGGFSFFYPHALA